MVLAFFGTTSLLLATSLRRPGAGLLGSRGTGYRNHAGRRRPRARGGGALCLAGAGQAPEDLGKIIRFDLARSGQFAMTAPEDMLSLPSRPEELYGRDWRVQGIAYVLLGSVRPTESGLEARYALYDVFAERLLFDETREARAGQLRALAHRISDRAYEQLTGIPGAFSTRLLYVVAQNIATEAETFA